MQKALIIDYKYCTGCHVCEVACRNEHGFALGSAASRFPMRVRKDGRPLELELRAGSTDLCDFCDARAAQGQDAACVHHCLAKCMEIVEVEDVSARLAALGKTAVCFVP